MEDMPSLALMDEVINQGSSSGASRINTMARRLARSSENRGSLMRMSGRMNSQTAQSPVRIWKTWMIVEIGFLLAVIALFNLFPQLIGIDRSPDAVTDPLPLIAPGIIDSLPWLNIWWGLALALNVLVVVFMLRSPKVSWARLALNFAGLILLLRMIFIGPLIAFNPEWLALQAADPSTLALMEKELAPALSVGITLFITAAILALGLNMIAKLRVLLSPYMRPVRSRLT